MYILYYIYACMHDRKTPVWCLTVPTNQIYCCDSIMVPVSYTQIQHTRYSDHQWEVGVTRRSQQLCPTLPWKSSGLEKKPGDCSDDKNLSGTQHQSSGSSGFQRSESFVSLSETASDYIIHFFRGCLGKYLLVETPIAALEVPCWVMLGHPSPCRLSPGMELKSWIGPGVPGRFHQATPSEAAGYPQSGPASGAKFVTHTSLPGRNMLAAGYRGMCGIYSGVSPSRGWEMCTLSHMYM